MESIVRIADNILSPLGRTTMENYQAVKTGQSALRCYEHLWDLPEACVVSLMERDTVEVDGSYTFFEKMAIQSAAEALSQTNLDPSSPRVVFVVSTTKGNVHLLGESEGVDERVLPGVAAEVIAAYFHNPNRPVVVSNACTSGVCAQIEAMRLLWQHTYDYAVVVGADVLSPFIVSGFQCLKALSPDFCRPFDAHRKGLNLGEAAATIVLARGEAGERTPWRLVSGAIRNDANHISGPSRVGEGSYRTLRTVLQDAGEENLAFVNAHGTATIYNDEMESIAIERAELAHLPVGSLKGHFGHTLGAAGVLETLISMCAVDDHVVLPTRGFESLGVTHPLLVSNELRPTDGNAFIKLLSGFGGCNAALLCRKEVTL